MTLMVITRQEALDLGLDKFFTGEPCLHGHLAFRYVKDKGCVECACQRGRAWARNNKEKHLEISRRWKKSNPTKVLKWKTSWRKRSKQSILKSEQKWRKNNPEKSRKIKLRYYSNNKEKFRAAYHARRAREGTFSKEDLEVRYQSQHGKCAYCKKKMAQKKMHVDHIIPIALGGSNYPANLQLTCRTCNLRKGAKDPVVFARTIGLLL